MAYFIGQSFPDIIIEVGEDISAATSVHVLYRKPESLQQGKWDAIINPSDNTQIVLTPTIDSFDEVGIWQLQAYADFGSGVQTFGNIALFTITEPLQRQING